MGKPDDRLSLGDRQARVIVVGPNRQLYALSAAKATGATALARELLVSLPAGPSATEAVPNASQPIPDLRTYLGDGRFFILGDQLSLPLDTKRYANPDGDGHTFLLRYTLNGQSISQLLPVVEGHLRFSRLDHLRYQGKPLSNEMLKNLDLKLYEVAGNQENLLATFQTTWGEETRFRAIVEELAPILKKAYPDRGHQLNEFYRLIAQLFGRTDIHLLESWLSREGFYKKIFPVRFSVEHEQPILSAKFPSLVYACPFFLQS
ncbi:MAG: hypothetical protein HC880_11810 [Bacteroidia bacterium]|nr:hypothetical protein [Bacteroidia bacterium]